MSPVDSNRSPVISSKRLSRRGATYLELVSVLLVIAIMGTVAIPNSLEFIARQRLQSAAEQIRQAILETTVVAKTSGVSQELIFVVGTGKVLIPGRVDPQSRLAPWTIDLKQIDPQLTIEVAMFDQRSQSFLTVTDGGRMRSTGTVRLKLNRKIIDLTVTNQDIKVGAIR